MPGKERRFELQGVEQFAGRAHQAEPGVDQIPRAGTAWCGAGKPRRIYGVRFRKPHEEIAVEVEAPGPVQINERGPAAGNFDIGADPVLPQPQPPYFRRPHDAAPDYSAAAMADERVLALSRSGHQRSSYSLHRPSICGSTSRLNRSILRLQSSVGIEPKCNSVSRWPTRSRFMCSINWSRTVFGLPTMTNPLS